MNIVHTEASCGWGGQEIRILVEARGMIARGHRVTLLAPVESRIFAEASRFGVSAVALPIGRKRLSGIAALRAWLIQNPVDVINTHSSTDSWLAALAWASLKKAPPIVRTRHISAPVPDNLASRWLYRSASRYVVTTGASLRESLIARLKLDATRVVSIPTGIDTEVFFPPTQHQRKLARKAIGVGDERFVIGIVATLRSWKGHRYLIEAFAEAFGDGASLAQFVIVGDGPQRAALEALVDAKQMRARVTFAGNQPDVVPWLHALDAFALPSYANEGVPQAILQAMACGIPVVTTDAGAIGEVATHEETALIVRKEDANDLASAIVRLAGDEILRARLASNARRLVRERHGIEAMLDKMEAVFEAARAGNGRPFPDVGPHSHSRKSP